MPDENYFDKNMTGDNTGEEDDSLEALIAEIEGADGEPEEMTAEDIFAMYKEELRGIPLMSKAEEKMLIPAVKEGDSLALQRLTEGKLAFALLLAESYKGRGLPDGDLVQEANLALFTALPEYREGNLDEFLSSRIRAALEEALQIQESEKRTAEEMRARVNVLKDISQAMAKELGREPSVPEMAERMKMTEEEIRDIMKLTLDAMSVTGV